MTKFHAASSPFFDTGSLLEMIQRINHLPSQQYTEVLQTYRFSASELVTAHDIKVCDELPLEKRRLAIDLVLRILWPRRPSFVDPRFSLYGPIAFWGDDTPEAHKLAAKEIEKTAATTSHVVFIGQQGRVDIELSHPFAVRQLWNAIALSEVIQNSDTNKCTLVRPHFTSALSQPDTQQLERGVTPGSAPEATRNQVFVFGKRNREADEKAIDPLDATPAVWPSMDTSLPSVPNMKAGQPSKRRRLE